jgi:Amt family ammonium transporter
VTFITFYAIDKLVGVRVSMEEEIAGLDISEHGISAYPEFDHKESYLEVMGDGVSTAPGVVPVADTEKEA